MKDNYDYSSEFSSDEIYEEEQSEEFETLEEKLRDVGMSIHDFI